MADGVKVAIGSEEYVVPPISCWAAKRIALAAKDAGAKPTTEDEWIDVLWEQIRLALEPGYPGLDVAALQKAVPLRDLADLHGRVMKAAGAARGEPGEAVSP